MKFLTYAALPLSLAACAATSPLPDAAPLTAASNPATATPSMPFDVLSGFRARPVTDPADWRFLNDLQGPDRGAGQ